MTELEQSRETFAEPQEATLLSLLLTACGIQNRFVNFAGTTEEIAQADLLAVLDAYGIDVRDAHARPDIDAIRYQLNQIKEHQQTRLLPPVVVVTRRSDINDHGVQLNIPEPLLSGELSWSVIREDGIQSAAVVVRLEQLAESHREQIGDTVFSTRHLPLAMTDLPEGYHQLLIVVHPPAAPDSISADSVSQTIPLIIAPSRCYEPAWVNAKTRIWGLSVQLYSFCTGRSWGMGDFLDLRNLIQQSAAQGASYLILNPLHAGPLHHPEHCSPYSPIDRRRLHPLYIAPELEPEFSTGAAGQWLSENEAAINLLRKTRDSEWIDYVTTAELKIRILATMFKEFQSCEPCDHKSAFEHFKTTHHNGLAEYAAWQAEQGCSAAGEFSHCPEFYIYLQWLAEKQLAACQQYALELGMHVGLIRDLAVGSDRNGAEVSCSNGVFSPAASIGAPPDPLAPQGQNWGLPPLNPAKLRDVAYQPFIDLIRSNMTNSGALRIDHVMSLMRLWWCPYEKSGQGAYVMYPADDLFAIMRLESQRQRCLIIGEDLGIVPDEVRRHLSESGIFSNLLFYFEKDSADSYRSPQHYTQRSLAMLANHDVPTLAAWWNGTDLTLRRALNLIADDTQLAQAVLHRQAEKKQVLQLLESQWLLPADRFGPNQLDKDMDSSLAAALMRCIARSSAMMVSVQLEDLILLKQPVNIPGTSTEYPNWRRKMPGNLLNIMDNESVQPMMESFRVERH